MNTLELGSAEFREMLLFVSRRIQENEKYLNSLDAASGDGDHGITMGIGFRAISESLSLMPASEISTMLSESGRVFMDATGGAIGVILGKMLIAAARDLSASSVFGATEFKVMLRAMEHSVARSGKVKAGDKTILDAIAGALHRADGITGDLAEVAAGAATGAEDAARQTANMLCRVGRASRLGERALGHPDPGATSFSIMMRAISDWLASRPS